MRYICVLVPLLLFVSLLSPCSYAQHAAKREFRAAWIATVANIDWPSKPGLPSSQQKQEFINRLDQIKDLGCNAVIVQVRPVSDALYSSKLEPWCHYLTGRQGEPPFPYYDPLAFMIEEAHKRQLEFHAWFNPFRALMDSRKNPNPNSHVTKIHKDWIINYDDKSYVNPGIPEARNYVMNVILDVVKRYDIDAVHLDDYFYPYPAAGQEFGDQRSFATYGGNFTDKKDWRRNNVNLFISLLNTNIKHLKYYVKLGISPFGVWRNITKDADGSATRATSNYDDLYADVVLWQQRGWIDYLMPQLYWEHGHSAASFDVLLPWWERHKYGRHMYYGLGVYNMSSSAKAVWRGPREILSQIKDIRNENSNSGFCFYSISSFDKIPSALADSVRRYNRTMALVPQMKWLDSLAPEAPVVKAVPSSQGTLLQWQTGSSKKEPVRYVVYRFVNNEAVNLERAEKIISVLSKNEFMDLEANRYQKCTYVVTALDRLWNESKASNAAVLVRE